MGMFSWIAMDTGRSIRNRHVEGYCSQVVHMTDNKGNVWREENYDGYGVFGGKDYYQLLAEMNELEGLTGDVDNDRMLGIDLAFSGSLLYISPSLNENPGVPWLKNQHNEICPDQGFFYDDEDEDDDETW